MFVGVYLNKFPTFAVTVLVAPHGRCGHYCVAFRDDNIIVCGAIQVYYVVLNDLSTVHRTSLLKGFRIRKQGDTNTSRLNRLNPFMKIHHLHPVLTLYSVHAFLQPER